MADITRPIFVNWTTSTTTNSIHILVAFGRIFSEINSSSKHSTYIGMSLIKSFMNNCIYERGACKYIKIESNDILNTEHFTVVKSFITHPKHNTKSLQKDLAQNALITPAERRFTCSNPGPEGNMSKQH